MELLETLKRTKELHSQNSIATKKYSSLSKRVHQTDIDSLFIVLGLLIGVILFLIILKITILLSADKDFLSNPILHLTLFIGILTFFFIKFRKIGKERKSNLIRQRIEQNSSEFTKLQEIIDTTAEELAKISLVPDKYLNEYSLDKLIEYISNKRADTLKEAINLLEDELIKTKHLQAIESLEKLQSKILMEQRAANKKILDAQKSTNRKLSLIDFKNSIK